MFQKWTLYQLNSKNNWSMFCPTNAADTINISRVVSPTIFLSGVVRWGVSYSKKYCGQPSAPGKPYKTFMLKHGRNKLHYGHLCHMYWLTNNTNRLSVWSTRLMESNTLTRSHPSRTSQAYCKLAWQSGVLASEMSLGPSSTFQKGQRKRDVSLENGDSKANVSPVQDTKLSASMEYPLAS